MHGYKGEIIMIKSMSGMVKKIFSVTDLLAGTCFFSVMILILANILMRNIFGHPITGTVEIVGLLIATGLGLALANCALNDGNIAMSIVTDRFSQGKQKVFDIIVYLVSLVFWAVVVWQIFVLANTSLANGRLSSTASIPIYPFVFILGFNVLCLCVVLFFKLVSLVSDIVSNFRNPTQKEMEEGK